MAAGDSLFKLPTLGQSVTGVGSALGSFGTAVGDLYTAQGAKAEADALGKAAGLAGQASGIAGENITLEEASTALQVFQQQRALSTTIGAQRAQVGASGFTESGSAVDLLAASREQGAIQRSVLEAQGAIQENAFREQQLAFQTQQTTDLAQQTAANIAAKNDKGAAFGNILKGALTIGALFL